MAQPLPHGLAALCHCVPRDIVWTYLKIGLHRGDEREEVSKKIEGTKRLTCSVNHICDSGAPENGKGKWCGRIKTMNNNQMTHSGKMTKRSGLR